MKNHEKIKAIVEETYRIWKDYPYLKYNEVLIKAKEVLKGASKRK